MHSLQRFLKSKDLDRTVEFFTYSHSRTKVLKYLIKVIDPGLRVCAVKLDGVSPDWEKRFAPAVAAQIGRDYSRVSLEGLTIGELEGAYRTRGRLDATVGAATVGLNNGCDGVSVTIPVTEGDAYTWAGTSWSGNAAMATAVLEPNLTAVRGAYGKVGHVQAQLSVSARGEATRRAQLEVQVTEGLQFRMGTLQLVGLTDADAAGLTKRWTLKPRQVFDALPVQQRRLMVRGPVVTADVAAKTVNVRYEFRPPER